MQLTKPESFEEKELVSVLVVDDQKLIADLIKSVLTEKQGFDVEVSYEIDDAIQKIKAKDGAFDVLLIEYEIPGMDGLRGVRTVLDVTTGSVVLFSKFMPQSDVERALSAGCKGFIPKTVNLRALGHAIRMVAVGEVFLPSSFAFGVDIGNEERSRFKPRELEVLSLLSEGLPNKEISRSLALQEWTVKMDVKAICRKLRANNRTQAVLLAKKMGLV